MSKHVALTVSLVLSVCGLVSAAQAADIALSGLPKSLDVGVRSSAPAPVIQPVVDASAAVPTVTAPGAVELSDVVHVCTEVAKAERDELAAEGSGSCIAATGRYLEGVNGLPLNQQAPLITSLVVELSNILFVPKCRVKSEIALAIEMAADRTGDAEQRAQVRLIGETVKACDIVVTASIATPRPGSLFPPASPNGPSASQN